MRTFGSTLGVFFLFALAVWAQETPQETVDFDYLKISRNVVRTTHSAKYRIYIDKPFKFLGRLDHKAVYGDIGFNISMAVFARGNDLLLIHAEKHSDGSGGLDYSDLTPAKLDDLLFTRRTQCASTEDTEELASNPQIRFIRSKGFDLSVPFQLEQFFTTSKDGTSEVVISYGRAVDKCSEELGAELRKELDEISTLAELEIDPVSDIYYLKVEIPLRSKCESRVGSKGLVTNAEYCSFESIMERGTKVSVSRSREKKNWEKLKIRSLESKDVALLFLSRPNDTKYSSLFDTFFTKHFDGVVGASCTNLEKPLDVLRELGFPSHYSRIGRRESWQYSVERPYNCMDFTDIRIKDGKVVEIAGSV
ncbi:MAG: hypothetical protein IPM63_00970 [Acidobacteriota bacterium]|nr:MAG: hypothetical protein IPM63_00970 [Acidobacteriota bacterium]